ncbi:MAG: DUF1080 domain-containing protein [Candidatus Glassbacteria bacterium]|nr:DUF1080 domain-containing protein [Candidatus Glassbacteria bacterium]
MKTARLFAPIFAVVLLANPAALPAAEDQPYDLSGFVSIFDGQTLDGWRPLRPNAGGMWTVEDGSIVGGQGESAGGGLLVTDRIYKNYELYGEVYTTWPLDTGFFLRILPDRRHYQITIDYRPTGEIGAVYGPFPGGGGGYFQHCPLGLSHWNPHEYNKVLVRIENNPPRIRVWVNGDKINDYQDLYYDNQPAFPDSGHVGIQVHAGESWGQGSKVAFKNLMIKELK